MTDGSQLLLFLVVKRHGFVSAMLWPICQAMDYSPASRLLVLPPSSSLDLLAGEQIEEQQTLAD